MFLGILDWLQNNDELSNFNMYPRYMQLVNVFIAYIHIGHMFHRNALRERLIRIPLQVEKKSSSLHTISDKQRNITKKLPICRSCDVLPVLMVSRKYSMRRYGGIQYAPKNIFSLI